jgi:DNA-binding transcriptional ArsR family regulator
MLSESQIDQLVRFFKVLGEPNRLKIVGLLAGRPHTGEELAALLGLGNSTVSHHLARLVEAGLVNSRQESYYNLYSLKTEALTATAKELLKGTERAEPESSRDLDAFDRKVLTTFLTPEGRIKAFPVQEKKFLVLVRYALKSFEPGIKYPEKRVNQMLANLNADTARLRRALVDHGFMAREGGGGRYWRIDKA